MIGNNKVNWKFVLPSAVKKEEDAAEDKESMANLLKKRKKRSNKPVKRIVQVTGMQA